MAGRVRADSGGARIATPGAPTADRIAELQRTAGNQAVAILVAAQGLGVQRDVTATHVLAKADEADVPKPEEMDALIAELWPLYAKSRESKKKDGTPMSDEDRKRMQELDRKWTLRGKGDVAKTLTDNGQGSAADWFKNVKRTTWLGQTIIVHDELKKRLDKALDKLKDVDEATRNGWVKETSSLRPPGQGLHSFGLALDINASTNPYLINPSGSSEAATGEPLDRSKGVRAVIDRANLLVLNRTAAEEAFGTRPEGAGLARAEASYDKLSEASGALKTYFTLTKPENEAQLEGLVTALGAKDPFKGDMKKWKAAIRADRTALEGHAGGKQWTNPTQGFLDIPKRLVQALTAPDGGGLTWLGDDTIGSGRDIMHFDTRGAGPIHSVYKAQGASKDAGSKNLGPG